MPEPATPATSPRSAAHSAFVRAIELTNAQAHAEALCAYAEAIRLDPAFTEAHFNRAVVHAQQGDIEAAEHGYRATLAVDPHFVRAHFNLANLCIETGRLEQGLRSLRTTVRIEPAFWEGWFNLAWVLARHGRHEEAILAFRGALQARPDSAETHLNLALVLAEAGRDAEAVQAFRRALADDPHGEARQHLHQRAYALLDDKLTARAELYWRLLAEIEPADAEHPFQVGCCLEDEGREDEAVAWYRQSAKLNPANGLPLFNLGNIYLRRGDSPRALEAYLACVHGAPAYAAAYINIGLIYQQRGEPAKSVKYYRTALQHDPSLAQAAVNLCVSLGSQARQRESIHAGRVAIDIDPTHTGGHSNLCNALQYDATVSDEELYREHRAWAERHARPLEAKRTPWHNAPDPARPLRIGYVSPDFRDHSVNFFFEPVLAAHDRSRYAPYLYSNAHKPDAKTQHLKSLAAGFRDIRKAPLDDILRQVRADGIDILVDLCGHFGGGRLDVFAAKPAPVQATWLGYAHSTGLDTIDYRFTDALADPPGETDPFHTESLWRLPGCFLCYKPSAEAPDIAPEPPSRTRPVTFGSFNTLVKINPEVVAAWCRILHAVPGSQLHLKSVHVREKETLNAFRGGFEQHGIDGSRIHLLPGVDSRRDHLALYHDIDVCLDPFPYNGTTTTFEALWMGVPVVTLCGQRHSMRVGTSILSRLGLEDLCVAHSEAELLAKATALATDPDRLADLRATLRPRLAKSTLCDAPAFARKLEHAYRTLWQHWCASQGVQIGC